MCKSIFVWPQPTDEASKHLYDDWGQSYYLQSDKLNLAFGAQFHEYLDEIERHRQSNRLLDVGCSTGSFLAAAKRRGWTCSGVELSTPATAYAREVCGLDVFNGTLQQAAYPAGSFDVVRIWAVLEHVSRPWELLKESHRILRDGGLLIICVPSVESLPIRILGNRYRYVCPSHLFYFSRRVLRILLERADFTSQRIASAYFSPLTFLQDFRGVSPDTTATEKAEKEIVSKARHGRLFAGVIRLAWRLFLLGLTKIGLGEEWRCYATKRPVQRD